MLLESSVMLLENIYSIGITYDDRHLQLSVLAYLLINSKA